MFFSLKYTIGRFLTGESHCQKYATNRKGNQWRHWSMHPPNFLVCKRRLLDMTIYIWSLVFIQFMKRLSYRKFIHQPLLRNSKRSEFLDRVFPLQISTLGRNSKTVSRCLKGVWCLLIKIYNGVKKLLCE